MLSGQLAKKELTISVIYTLNHAKGKVVVMIIVLTLIIYGTFPS